MECNTSTAVLANLEVIPRMPKDSKTDYQKLPQGDAEVPQHVTGSKQVSALQPPVVLSIHALCTREIERDLPENLLRLPAPSTCHSATAGLRKDFTSDPLQRGLVCVYTEKYVKCLKVQ